MERLDIHGKGLNQASERKDGEFGLKKAHQGA